MWRDSDEENIIDHLNRVQFIVELQEEHAEMTASNDHLFKQWNLVLNIGLIAEKTSHAIALVLNWTNKRGVAPT